MKPLVLLFDIDGTILLTGGVGQRAMAAAFAQLHARPDACSGFSFGGMTDPAIIRRALLNIDVQDTPNAISTVLDAYLLHLEEGLRQPLPPSALLPGVNPLLERLSTRSDLAVGLGTGNIKPGALLKLAAVGLHNQFSFGGFGCDAENRNDLIRIGAQRGADLLGLPLDHCRVIILGDTPRDIEAANAIHAEVIAVATGPFSRTQLEELSPTLCCDTLEDKRIHDFLGI